MRLPSWSLPLLLAIVACGDDGGGVTDPPDAAPADAVSPDAAPAAQANRVFITQTGVLGDFGGLAAADAVCASEAAAAGLDGTYVAWLSTSTVDARDRLAGSRGWVRTDGVPVMDTVAAMIDDNRMFNPVDRDATGAPLEKPMWTGTGRDGRVLAGGTCDDWSSEEPDAKLGVSTASMSDFTNGFDWDCFINGAFYCFEVGHSTEVVPVPDPTATRYAFVSRQLRGGGGLGALDAICAAEATAAQLPGTYLAAVATTTASVASRFEADARSWRRVDGTLVAGPDFLTAIDRYTSFVNQRADGSYTATTVTSGGPDPTALGRHTCGDWQSVQPNVFFDEGHPIDAGRASFWGAIAFIPCSVGLPVLCLEE